MRCGFSFSFACFFRFVLFDEDHKWNDVVMIPEYLNHIEAGLYLWSAVWYAKEDGNYGFYTTRLHIIETTAAFVELFASFGWFESIFEEKKKKNCLTFCFI